MTRTSVPTVKIGLTRNELRKLRSIVHSNTRNPPLSFSLIKHFIFLMKSLDLVITVNHQGPSFLCIEFQICSTFIHCNVFSLQTILYSPFQVPMLSLISIKLRVDRFTIFPQYLPSKHLSLEIKKFIIL